jgi:hypothetical protein
MLFEITFFVTVSTVVTFWFVGITISLVQAPFCRWKPGGHDEEGFFTG